MLHTLIGYVARPMGIQLVFYLTTPVLTWLLMGVVGGGSGPKKRSAGAAQTALVLLIVGLAQFVGAPG